MEKKILCFQFAVSWA